MTGDKPFSRILVPLDGSDHAKRAIFPATELARRAGVPLTLFRLVDSEFERRGVQRELDAVVAEIGGSLVVDTLVTTAADAVIASEFVAETIVAEAAQDNALICMASHGRSAVGRAVLGSVAEQVLLQMKNPVLVVGPRFESHFVVGNGRVVAGVDGSRFAERALGVAASWAAAFEMPLWLVQVVDPDAAAPGHLVASGDLIESSYLARQAEQFPGANFDLLHNRHPAHELADLPDRWPVGLLVLATHGRTGWSRLTAGSVAMHVVHHARCPVLLVRADPTQ